MDAPARVTASVPPGGGEGLAVVIPTYRREAVLIDTLRRLLALQTPACEIIVVDQTPNHEPSTERRLRRLEYLGHIRRLRRDVPSIPAAMNAGLLAAGRDIVLFLDDDIVPHEDLVAAHLGAQARHPGLVAGQVLQPGAVARPLEPGEDFRFDSSQPASIREFMGGNFSVRRGMALALGGFDESFIGAAYRFEAEFAHRFVARHGGVRFEPSASLRHLQAPAGGTRAHGHHLRTSKPAHSVGAYYCWLRTRAPGWRLQMLARPWRSIRTRHHLRQPWWIPVTLLAEVRGLLLALRLARRPPRLLPCGEHGPARPAVAPPAKPVHPSGIARGR
jgi:GT2 family glycosyltransferase